MYRLIMIVMTHILFIQPYAQAQDVNWTYIRRFVQFTSCIHRDYYTILFCFSTTICRFRIQIYIPIIRSSPWWTSIKRVFLKILQNSLENTCFRVFFNKVVGINPGTLLKNILLHRCFPVNFTKFLRTSFSQNTSGWRLLLNFGTDILFCAESQKKTFRKV